MRFFPRRLHQTYVSKLDQLMHMFASFKPTESEQDEIDKHQKIALKRDGAKPHQNDEGN
jgi:hypothetical protein